MELVWLGNFVHRVARIRASHPYQVVVLRCQICRDMAFSFAAILPSNQHVNEPLNASAIEAEPGCCPDEHVGSRILLGIYDNVGDVSQFCDGTFGRVSAYLIIGGKLLNIWGSA